MIFLNQLQPQPLHPPIVPPNNPDPPIAESMPSTPPPSDESMPTAQIIFVEPNCQSQQPQPANLFPIFVSGITFASVVGGVFLLNSR